MVSDRKRRRIQLQKESIFNQEPNAFEQKLIHSIFMTTMDCNNRTFNVRNIPPGAMWMEDAQLSNVIYSHPEDRLVLDTINEFYQISANNQHLNPQERS